LWPEHLPELRRAVDEYLAAAVETAEALMRGMALALGLPAGHFAVGLTGRPTLLFRIFRYPPGAPTEGFGVGEHSDYGLLTLLGQDGHGGLEVRTENGDWVAVLPRRRVLVVNVGDMFERLTRGRFRSAPHRVINRSGRERLSYPLFYDPDFAAPVDPLPIPAEATALVPRWDGIDVHETNGTYGDYLLGKVSKAFPELAGKALATSDRPGS
jgi:isopenicillin N synthase-like dioxygenase